MNDLTKSLPKDWQAQDARLEASAVPKKDSVKFAMTLRRPDQSTINFFGYIVPDRVTYELVDYTTEKTEPAHSTPLSDHSRSFRRQSNYGV